MTDRPKGPVESVEKAEPGNDKSQPGRHVSVDGQKIYPETRPTPQDHEINHSASRLRAAAAFLIGGLAVYLIVAAVVLAWAKDTLLSTPSYVSTVTAVARQPDVQKYAGQKISQTILDNTPSSELVKRLVPAEQQRMAAALPPDQLKIRLQPYVQSAVNQVIISPQFLNFWENTNRSIHSLLISALQTTQPQVRIDLSSMINELVKLLRSSPALSFIDTTDLSMTGGSFDINADQLKDLRRGYQTAERYGLATAILLATVATVAAIVVSNRRLRTLQRTLVFATFSMLLLAFIITLPSRLHPNVVDPAAWAAAVSVLQTLLGGLAKLSIVIALICLVALAFSFVVPALIKRSTKPTTSLS